MNDRRDRLPPLQLCHLLSTVDFEGPSLRAVQMSTVDAFQGAEKDVVILSCVRTRQVGFIDSEKRMNVALTRGRRHLLIVGNLACLRRNRLWGRVIEHCEGRGGLSQAFGVETGVWVGAWRGSGRNSSECATLGGDRALAWARNIGASRSVSFQGGKVGCSTPASAGRG